MDWNDLDRPAIAALRSHHRVHAESLGLAMRYQPDVAPFIAAINDTAEALADVGRFIPEDRFAIMLQRGQSPLPPGTRTDMQAEGVQMVAQALPASSSEEFLPLSENDAREMVDLAALTRPGPFLIRTHEFGGYIGIRHHGRLVAMAGERFRFPGFAEVSAVCTHPDYRGKGYARALMLAVAARIVARGETPFLHALAANTTAIALYQKLGFVFRTRMSVTVLRRA